MKISSLFVCSLAASWTVMVVSGAAAQTALPRPAVPVDPIGAILDAFGSHKVVALGEGTHANEQGHAFRLKLIRDPRFAAAVNDIVVECGNSRYQDVIDRFVRGEDVPYDVLRQVWQNTTQPDMLWDLPIYEEFFRAVRAVNAALPKERQLRVLLGDPPIEWGTVRTAKDYGDWDRDGHPADLIRREVLARGRTALVVYGDLHFIRKNPQARSDQDPAARSIVGLLEAGGATKAFTIRTIAYGIDLEKQLGNRQTSTDLSGQPVRNFCVSGNCFHCASGGIGPEGMSAPSRFRMQPCLRRCCNRLLRFTSR